MIHEFFLKQRRWMAGIMLAALFGMVLEYVNPIMDSPKNIAETQEAHLRPEPLYHPKSPESKDDAVQFETESNEDMPSTQLNSNEPPASSTQNPNIDIHLLARLIHAEARGEPFEGQVAVGAVLMNRMRNPRFPKTLEQNIFKRGEFCTVRDGQIWMNPNEQAIKAARLAAEGWDPTNGAHYFYNPAKTTSRWIWSRPVVHRIGQHVFAV